MALLNVIVVIAFAALCQCLVEEDNATKILSVTQNTSVQDKYQEPIAVLKLNLTVYGKSNHSADHKALSDFVSEKLSILEAEDDDDEDMTFGLTEYVKSSALPLQFQLTLTEDITIGPTKPVSMRVELSLELYAQKRHRRQALSALRKLRTL